MHGQTGPLSCITDFDRIRYRGIATLSFKPIKAVDPD
jgi:hypothetical protein